MSIKTYSEVIRLPTFLERYEYLRIGGRVGSETFGHDRYLNQILYNSHEWRSFKRKIILRDEGRDLACEGFEIYERVFVHHINPVSVDDIINKDPKIFDPNNVITTSFNTHNAIHYGDKNLLMLEPIERTKNDTSPWRR